MLGDGGDGGGVVGWGEEGLQSLDEGRARGETVAGDDDGFGGGVGEAVEEVLGDAVGAVVDSWEVGDGLPVAGEGSGHGGGGRSQRRLG